MMWYFYKTLTTNNIYPIAFGSTICKVRDLVYEPEIIRDLCKKGCQNYNYSGGCPPRAPLLYNITDEGTPAWLIYALFLSDFKPTKILNSKNVAMHWKFQDNILSRLLVKLGRALVEDTNGYLLATGYCQGCAGIKCSFKLGDNVCRNPSKRIYSMEATGINVVATVKKSFDLNIYWYNKNNINDVPYLLKCMAILAPDINKEVEKRFIIQELNKMPSCFLKIGDLNYERRIMEIGLPQQFTMNNKP